MVREIKTYPENVLCVKAAEIEAIDDAVRALAADMVETMYKGKGIGLAAPQVGESVRLITVDISGPENRDDLHVLVNPRVVERNGEVESEEGCLSVPGQCYTIRRAANVTVEALDLEGQPVDLRADGLLGICLQHEIDHLDGVLILDHISRLKRVLFEKKIKKQQIRSAHA